MAYYFKYINEITWEIKII